MRGILGNVQSAWLCVAAPSKRWRWLHVGLIGHAALLTVWCRCRCACAWIIQAAVAETNVHRTRCNFSTTDRDFPWHNFRIYQFVSLTWKRFYTFENFDKLWCESTTNPVPVLRIAASHGFSELTQNWIRSHLPWKFHGYRSSHFLVILLTLKQRKIHTNKEIDRKQYPVPRSIGDRVKIMLCGMFKVSSSFACILLPFPTGFWRRLFPMFCTVLSSPIILCNFGKCISSNLLLLLLLLSLLLLLFYNLSASVIKMTENHSKSKRENTGRMANTG